MLVNTMAFECSGIKVAVDSLCKCVFTQSDPDSNPNKTNVFKLVIDRRIKDYPYLLDIANSRFSIIDTQLNYINTPDLTKSKLPPIFTTNQIQGKSLMDVLHPEVSVFYKDLLISCFQDKAIVKLHVVLNNAHILLTAYPVTDNRNTVMAGTIVETAFLDVMNQNALQYGSSTPETGEIS